MNKEKKCTGCDCVKTDSHFHKNKSKKDGLSSYCKGCSKEYMIEYQMQNVDRIRVYNQERYKKKTNGI